MSEAMERVCSNLMTAISQLAEAAKLASDRLRDSLPEPVETEQPERFEHRDIDGDRVLVYPHDYPGFESVLMVETDSDPGVRLSQDAVNRLAQYLDRYRTDGPCPGKLGHLKYEQQCAGVRGHDGPCSPDADMIGAPVQPPDCCGHLKQDHGHHGCQVLPCPCRCGTSL